MRPLYRNTYQLPFIPILRNCYSSHIPISIRFFFILLFIIVLDCQVVFFNYITVLRPLSLNHWFSDTWPAHATLLYRSIFPISRALYIVVIPYCLFFHVVWYYSIWFVYSPYFCRIAIFSLSLLVCRLSLARVQDNSFNDYLI